MIKVYIAAPSELQQVARNFRDTMQLSGGIVVTSQWLNEDFSKHDNPNLAPAFLALMDLVDIERCDVFFLINPEEWARKGTGGRHVELGYAMHANKRIIIYGTRTNSFHNLPKIAQVENGDFVKAILDVMEA